MPFTSRPDRASRPSLRRPNGRPQACEPCRKRKVACDNEQPVCRRCQKAAREPQCEYILDSRMSILSPSSPARTPQSPTQNGSPIPSTGPSRIIAAIDPSDAGIDSILHSLSATPLVSGPGYLGPTSFYNIYEEAESRLPYRGGNGATISSPAQPGSVPSGHSPALSQAMLDTCRTVLRQLPLRGDAEKMAPQDSYPGELFFVAAGDAIGSFYDCFGQHLGRNRTDEGLAEVAKALCLNTSRAFSDNEVEPASWTAQFCGPNSRWELLGIMFTHWASRADVFSPLRQDLSGGPRHRFELARYLKLVNTCIDISRSFTHGNTLLLFMVMRRSIIESWISGDASPLVWQYHSDTHSLLTFLGLHAETSRPAEGPTLCSEWKRRLCCYIFNGDKGISSFTGRPPSLGRRYVLTPMPLDLADAELVADRATLMQAVQDLDENGWNRKEKLYPATFIRARRQIAQFRDEVFEMALGLAQATSAEELLDVLEREKSMMETLPTIIRFQDSHFLDPAMSQHALYSRLVLRLEHLQTHFFIHRLLIQRGHEDSHRQLLAVSFEMVSLTLLFWTHLDQVPRMVMDLEWLVMSYAAPSGGILCQELLRRTGGSEQAVIDGPSALVGGVEEGVKTPTRFAILEKMFLLVGFLDWVSPSAPNSDLCRSCKNVIRHVLEQTTQEQPLPTEGAQPAPGIEPWNWDLGDTALDFEFDLLDTFDWLRPDLGGGQEMSEGP